MATTAISLCPPRWPLVSLQPLVLALALGGGITLASPAPAANLAADLAANLAADSAVDLAGDPTIIRGGDQPFVLEVVHLGPQGAGYEASCDVTDGLGITRSSTFTRRVDGTVRLVGTQVACALRGSGDGLLQVILRSGQKILMRVEGPTNQPLTIAARGHSGD